MNENASQLFARLTSSKDPTTTTDLKTQNEPQILNLDSNLFPNGILNKQIIEISGQVGSGKTELILHLIARCLIKNKFLIDLDGGSQLEIDLSELCAHQTSNLNQTCILINTDSKPLFILRLFKIIETLIQRLIECNYGKIFNDSKKSLLIKKQIVKFIKCCLNNLIVYRSYTRDEFVFSLAACEIYIQSKLNENKEALIPIFIDTINSNFEFMDKYYKSIGASDDANSSEKFSIGLIRKIIDKYNVCVIASRSIYSNNDCMKNWSCLINKRIELNLNEEKKPINNEENELNIDENFENFIFSLKLIDINEPQDTNNKIFFITNEGFNLK